MVDAHPKRFFPDNLQTSFLSAVEIVRDTACGIPDQNMLKQQCAKTYTCAMRPKKSAAMQNMS
jgi:hypothetical protein